MRRPLATPPEVSEYLGVPVTTLMDWRYRKVGPPSIRVGRHVRYRWEAVEKWLNDGGHRQ